MNLLELNRSKFYVPMNCKIWDSASLMHFILRVQKRLDQMFF